LKISLLQSPLIANVSTISRWTNISYTLALPFYYSSATADISSWEKDEWHHIAATWDNSTGSMSLYIDGTLEDSSTAVTTPTLLAEDMYVGYQADSVIDDFTIFEYARNSSQIANDYSTQIASNLNITLSINNTSGIVTLIPSADWYGERRIKFFASDSYARTGSNLVNLEVTSLNEPPYLNNTLPNMTLGRTALNTSIDLDDYFADIDNSTLIYAAGASNDNVSISINGSNVINVSTSGAQPGTVTVTINATDDISITSSEFIVTITNLAPQVSGVVLNSTLGANTTSENITCWIGVSDGDDTALTANFSWYNNSVSHMNGSAGISSSSVSTFVSVSTMSSLVRGHNWSCTVQVSDGYDISADIDATDFDSDDISYFDNSSTINISNSTGLINFTPEVLDDITLNITICDNSSASNNCTSDIFTIDVIAGVSIIVSSSINYIHYDGNYSNITGITDSVINISNITGPVISVTSSNIYNSIIINSTILRCNVSDSVINNTGCTDAEIDPSDIKESDTTGSDITNSHVWYSNATNSIIVDSTIDYSDIDNSNITYSTITNSSVRNSAIADSVLFDSIVMNANITGDILYSGNVTYNGSTYDADTLGPTNLTNVLNYAPTANIATTPTSARGTVPLTVTFDGTVSTDPNIPGDFINDSLTYAWDFNNSGTTHNTSNVTSYTYNAVGTYVAVLTVTDKFGQSDSTNKVVIVDSPSSSPGVTGGGGGGGGSSGPTVTSIKVTEEGVEACLKPSDQVTFALAGQYHIITLLTLGDYYTTLSMPSVEGNLLGGKILLYVNQSAKFDINRNQTYDFYLELDRIQYNMGCLLLRSIHESAQSMLPPITPMVEDLPTPRPPIRTVPPGEVYSRPVKPGLAPETGISIKDMILELIPQNILLGIIPIFLILAVLAGVIIHKRSGIVVEEKTPSIDKYVSSLMAKGESLQEVHNELLKKGWPAEAIYVAELKHLIIQASKKMNIKQIHDELIKKGWPKNMVKSVILNHFMKKHISKGKSFEQAKDKLVKAGWKEEEIHKHLKKAK
jgi:uncharacterized protein YjbI with pentapeptide repeats